MPSLRLPRLGGLVAAVVASAIAMTGAQQRPEPLTMGPARERGASVTPAFEGWYENEDGSFSLLIGYFNRNSKEALDIPIGPNNRIEPGAPIKIDTTISLVAVLGTLVLATVLSVVWPGKTRGE